MRIAVNARFLLKDRLEGLGRFSHEVLKRMVLAHPEHEFLFFFDRPYAPEFVYAENVTPIVVNPPARHPYLYVIWFEYRLPALFRKYGAEVFFSPDGFLSLRSSIPQVPVIHDLAFEHYPQYVSKAGARYYRKYFPRFVHKAARIATVSEYSKQDIVRTYGADPEHIEVVYNGVSSSFGSMEEAALDRFRQDEMEGKPWFVYLGSMHPRKNISRLLRAFDHFKKNDDRGYRLVLVGRKAWQVKGMEEVYESMEYRESVIFTGRIPDEKVQPYLAGARALVYVPLFEGFGLPLIEAFQCGVPALTSSVSSLPEVAGDAALCVNPLSEEEMAKGMHTLADNEEIHARLKSRTKERASAFSWDDTAGRCWNCLEKVILDRA